MRLNFLENKESKKWGYDACMQKANYLLEYSEKKGKRGEIRMGLSEEDKAKHPYYKGQRAEEEKKKWEKFTKSPEYIQIRETYQRAVEDHLHQLLMGDFYARDLKATAEQVVSATSFWMIRLSNELIRTRFYLTANMLERFDLVKKKATK